MRLVPPLAVLAVLALGTVPALAACPTRPDAAANGANSTEHLLCLQRELSTTSDGLAEQARRNAESQRINDLLRDSQKLIGVTPSPFPSRSGF